MTAHEQRHKTDNMLLAVKVELRRRMLERFHKSTTPNVFDACQGEGIIWKMLRPEFPLHYIGVDVKARAGQIQLNSIRLLSSKGWDYDIIDVDTYGNPWSHYFGILETAPHHPLTIFLTIGSVPIGPRSVDQRALMAMGFTQRLARAVPLTLRGRLEYLALDYSLARAYHYGWQIPYALEAPGNLHTRYIALRLERSG